MRSEARTIQEEHGSFRLQLETINQLADSIGDLPAEEVLPRATDVHEFLAHTVMPHAVAEGAVLFPVVRKESGELTIGVRMTQCHVQLSGLVDQLEEILISMREDPSMRIERRLRKVLYSVQAILSAHLAEAEEEIQPLLDANLEPEERQHLFQAVERCAREVADLYE
jgi:Hemerythrin HHE cation binding domain